MKVTATKLKGVYVVEPQVFGDARGWFMESWSKRKLEEGGIHVDFVQDNQSYSAEKGTLRGLHYQLNPMCQAKLRALGWTPTQGLKEMYQEMIADWEAGV